MPPWLEALLPDPGTCCEADAQPDGVGCTRTVALDEGSLAPATEGVAKEELEGGKENWVDSKSSAASSDSGPPSSARLRVAKLGLGDMNTGVFSPEIWGV